MRTNKIIRNSETSCSLYAGLKAPVRLAFCAFSLTFATVGVAEDAVGLKDAPPSPAIEAEGGKIPAPTPTSVATPAPVRSAGPSEPLEKANTPSPIKDSVANSSEPPVYRDLRIPLHQYVRPSVGLGLDYSPSPFGNQTITNAQSGNTAFAVGVSVQYQPTFLQPYGVLGIGPSFSVYPIAGSVTKSVISVVSGGGKASYQLRYFRNQFLVPVVSYSAEYLYYDFLGSPVGGFLIKGPSVALWFLLNIIEPSVANSAYVSTGIVRMYLTAEVKRMEGSTPSGDVLVSGNSWYFGLRFEF